MRGILDIYLKNLGTTRYEVSKRSGISEQALSKANKRDPKSYTVKTVELIASAVGKSAGEVLDSLVEIRDCNILYKATTLRELEQKVADKEDEFLVEGEFAKIIKEAKEGQLSEMAQTWFAVGSSGSGTILAWFITELLCIFDKKNNPKTERLKHALSTLYDFYFIDKHTIKLTLKSNI